MSKSLDMIHHDVGEYTKSTKSPRLRFATLINDSGDVEGHFYSYKGLTEDQWANIAEDLECAWGVYLNDCDVSLPVAEIDLPTKEEREYSGGWWDDRTLESIIAFRKGPVAFFCHIAQEHGESVQPLRYLPDGAHNSHVQIHWI